MLRSLTRLLFLLAALACAAAPAGAVESAPVSSPRATATLVTDRDGAGPHGELRVALRLRIAPGWHTYWRNPGEAGAAPELTLTLPEGARAGEIAWPTPRRVTEGGLTTYAYSDQVLLPVTVTFGKAGGPAEIKARATWLVCKDICVPEEGDFSVALGPGPGAPSAQAALFAAADRMMPRPSPWEARIAADGALWVGGAELTPATVTDAWFIPDRPGMIQDDAAQPLSVRQGGFTLALHPAKGFRADAGLSGVLSVRDRAGLQTDVALLAAPGQPPSAAVLPVWRMLALAFLGGAILNLMPCVFPILAMKTVALARGAAHGAARAHAVSYAAGVLATFAALGGALLAARAAGYAAGWGFQFQSPVFVAAMVWLLFGVGLNLSGVFTVGSGLAGVGQGLIGQKGAGRGGHAGSFLTGLLAVLVATPCTAPFMAAAIAGALAAPPAVTILVFLAMGAGLAAPYVALAALPGLSRAMPRPGPWMETLRQVLAFPMYAAAVWLLWVVTQEAGADGVLATGVGLVLVGFAAWAAGRAQRHAVQGRRIFQAAALVAVLAAAGVLGGIALAPAGVAATPEAAGPGLSGRAEAFTPDRLAALRASGRPVFVNMTAAWCVTCLVNERVAIRTASVEAAFAARGIAYLKGDWTRQDPVITAFLQEHGRDGVPLYLYYPPRGAPPVVLPQILTEGIVLDRIGAG
ncbi:MAG: thioredoxin family protein [Proteobacteria bacterium]|nr:thioredoxin family protein [Pseudomonadota bacterium]